MSTEAIPAHVHAFWPFLSRWGNALLLLPAAAAIAAGLWASGARRRVVRWGIAFALVAAITLLSKLLFLGWGIGIAALDFTGVSGHSMLAAAIYPMLGWWLAQDADRSRRRLAIAAGVAFALTIGISRLAIEVHSLSEVLSGVVLGSLAWAFALRSPDEPGTASPLRWIVPIVLAVVGAATPVGDANDTHGLIVRIALDVSGRTVPFTREVFARPAS